MKIVSTLTASAILSAALAVPAIACEYHGGGFGFSGANWQPYQPRVSQIDPAMEDDSLEALMQRAVKAVPAAPAKPSFSSVAMRASERALARRAEATKADANEDDTAVKSAALETKASDSDR